MTLQDVKNETDDGTIEMVNGPTKLGAIPWGI